MEKRWLKVPKAAEYLGVGEATIYRWIKAGNLGDELPTGTMDSILKQAGL